MNGTKGIRDQKRQLWIAYRVGIAALAAIQFLASAGCSKQHDPRFLPVFPATGTVTFKGQPPVGAYIALHPKDAALAKDPKFIPPRASVQPDGTFVLSSYNSNDGATPGEYVVTFEWHKTIKRSNGEPDLGPNLLPPQYSKVKTSPVIVKIAEGKNELPPIVLK
jgi:hypothetical protein